MFRSHRSSRLRIHAPWTPAAPTQLLPSESSLLFCDRSLSYDTLPASSTRIELRSTCGCFHLREARRIRPLSRDVGAARIDTRLHSTSGAVANSLRRWSLLLARTPPVPQR